MALKSDPVTADTRGLRLVTMPNRIRQKPFQLLDATVNFLSLLKVHVLCRRFLLLQFDIGTAPVVFERITSTISQGSVSPALRKVRPFALWRFLFTVSIHGIIGGKTCFVPRKQSAAFAHTIASLLLQLFCINFLKIDQFIVFLIRCIKGRLKIYKTSTTFPILKKLEKSFANIRILFRICIHKF